jgi:hypothetical protein
VFNISKATLLHMPCIWGDVEDIGVLGIFLFVFPLVPIYIASMGLWFNTSAIHNTKKWKPFQISSVMCSYKQIHWVYNVYSFCKQQTEEYHVVQDHNAENYISQETYQFPNMQKGLSMSTTLSFHSEFIIRSLFILICWSTSCSVAQLSLALCRQASSWCCSNCRAPALLLLPLNQSAILITTMKSAARRKLSPWAAVICDFHRWPLFLTHSVTNGTPRYMVFLPSSFAACREYTYPMVWRMSSPDAANGNLTAELDETFMGKKQRNWLIRDKKTNMCWRASLSPRTYCERNSFKNRTSFSSFSLHILGHNKMKSSQYSSSAILPLLVFRTKRKDSIGV